MKEAHASPKDAALKLALEALEKLTNAAEGFSVSGVYFNEELWARKCLDDAYDAMGFAQEALAQPEQRSVSEHLEPVATLDDLEQEIYENTRQFVSRDVMEWMLKRYYTTPPQRKPLTDEQIMGMYNEPRSDAEMLEFARAIEAAHGIKE